MKKLLKIALLFALLSTLYGCASSGEKFETRLAPPDAFNPYFIGYQQFSGQKVMVVAVDPTGQWAYGIGHDKKTLEEAAQEAAVKCDKEREKHKVYAKAKLFAINDEIVYYNRK